MVDDRQARAARDQQPRGLRLITGQNSTNSLYVTELQYTETTLVILSGTTSPGAPIGDPSNSPNVYFNYTLTSGVVTNRTCMIWNLNADQAAQVGAGGLLVLPLLGIYPLPCAYFHILTASNPQNNGSGLYNVTVTLDVYPDPQLGAGTQYTTYHFGVYSPPRPLLGEPVLQLPKNICVDLNPVTIPNPPPLPPTQIVYVNTAPLQDYDIIFLPSGLVLPMSGNPTSGNAQVYFWVRDYTKPGGSVGDFNTGGEQQVVSLKTRSGSLGVFPIAWPNVPAANGNPFYFAQHAASSP